MERGSTLREIALVYAAVCGATFLLTRLRTTPLGDWVEVLVGALFLLVAIRLAQREEHGLERCGIDLSGLLVPPPEDDSRAGPLGLFDLARALRGALPAAVREGSVAIAVAALVFPPFVVAFRLWNGARHPFIWNPPPHFASFVLGQLIVVGLPEEALFRGWFQTRLTDAFPRTRRLLGVELSVPALLAQAALFALIHFVVDGDPRRLAVFFPALLFGWVRAWRRGIGASLTLHALSNVLAKILIRGWL